MTDTMSETTTEHSSVKSRLRGMLNSPLVGLSPWIVYAMVEGKGRLELSAGIALGIAVVIVSLNWLNGSTPKILEFSDVVYFAGLAVVVSFADAGTRSWLETWGGEVANIALVVIALGSILIRNPFTLSYAREGTPKEFWDSPEFLRVNYLISWVWVAAFVVEAVSGLVGDGILHNPNNLWTGWIIQTFPLIVAAQFTIWYPNRLEAIRDGRAESAPTVRDFAATVTPWVTTVGIIALSVGGTPQAVSITLIVLGIVLTRSLTTKEDSASVESGGTMTAAAG